MRVAIVGAGYVGIVTGACLAEKGHEVVCVDVDAARVAAVNRGESPIYEPGLAELLESHAGKRLRATTDLEAAVTASEVTLIAVGTPYDGTAIDLSFVEEAARQIGAALQDTSGYHVVAVKSTVVPGTTGDVVLPILEKASGREAGYDFGVGMNPEFLTEGTAVEEFMAPDRIVLGGIDETTIDILDRLYEGFEAPRIRTNNRTAEMIKYASNALLATCISFSNEIANLCSSAGGIDAVDVMRGVHLSRYLSPRLPGGERVTAPLASFLEAGCGFGGSCLPKDVSALTAWGDRRGRPSPMLRAVIRVNEERPEEMIRLVKKHVPSLERARVTVLGLAFKPDTDDTRRSPAIPVVNRLAEEGALVKVYDPAASEAVPALFRSANVAGCRDLFDAVRDADAVVLVTRWDEFRDVPGLLKDLVRQPVFIDGRRMLDRHDFARYDGIGL
jgi:UDPglucose 6-dehydrogenase